MLILNAKKENIVYLINIAYNISKYYLFSIMRDVICTTTAPPTPQIYTWLPPELTNLDKSKYQHIDTLDTLHFSYHSGIVDIEMDIFLPPPAFMLNDNINLDVEASFNNYLRVQAGRDFNDQLPALTYNDYYFWTIWVTTPLSIAQKQKRACHCASHDRWEMDVNAALKRRMHYAITCVRNGCSYGEINVEKFIDEHPLKDYYHINTFN